MTAAPERIFATCTGGRHWVEIRVGEYQTEYVRADVAAAQIAERDAEIEKWRQTCGMMEQISLHDERIRKRDAIIADLEAELDLLTRPPMDGEK